MKRSKRSIFLPIIVLFILAFSPGCSPASVNPENDLLLPLPEEGISPSPTQEKDLVPPPEQIVIEPITPTQGEPVMPTPQSPPPYSSNLDNLIETAKQDLAERLSMNTSEIAVVEAREVVWPNGALGCPQPGMMYAEVLTPGYLILLNASGMDYEYHASKGTEVVHCTDPQPPAEGTPDDV